MKTKKIYKKQKNLVIIFITIITFLCGVCLSYMISNINKIDYYTSYIGKYYKDVPPDFEIEDFNDSFKVAKTNKKIKYLGYSGAIQYSICVNEIYKEAGFQINTLRTMTWTPDKINQTTFNSIKNKLEKKYGNYNDFKNFNDDDNNVEETDGEYVFYYWYDIDNYDITLGCQINENNNVNDMYITWEIDKPIL